MQTLQRRIQRILLVAMLIVMTILVIYFVISENNRQKNNDYLIINNTLELFDQKIDDFHKLSSTSLAMFINDGFVGHANDGEVSGENIVDVIEGFSDLFDESYSIALATVNGEMYTRKDIQLPDSFDPRTRAWYIEAIAKPDTVVLSQPYESANEPGVYVITYSKTIKHHDTGTLIGVAGMNAGLRSLFEFTNTAKLEQGSFIALASEDGKVLTDNIHDVLYAQQITIDFEHMMNEVDAHNLVEIDGKSYDISFKQNEDTQWWSVIFIPHLDFWETYKPTIAVTLIVMILGVILIKIISWYIGFKMTKSINSIVAQVESLELLEEKTTIDYEKSGMRDVVVIAEGINRLLERVFNLRDSLTSKQEEITHQYSEIEALYEETAAMNESLNDTVEQLEKSWYQTIRVLSNAIEASDEYTKGHCDRVAEYSVLIGELHGFMSNEIRTLELAALLHDVGKVGIPDRILNKKGSLTEEEYEIIKKHSLTGYNIIQDVPFLANSAEIILNHHERIDGKGYPNGLTGDQLSLEAKILAVVDAYDAMTSTRAYRPVAKTSEEAIEELEKYSGTQFDAYVLTLLKKVIVIRED